MTRLSVAEAQQHLMDLVEKVAHEGETILLTDGDKPVAKLVPAVQEDQAGLHPEADDPLEEFIGAFNSGGTDWADQHDAHLGKSIHETMRG